MAGFEMYSIRRQARKEAWYSDPLNPFRQVGRSQSWNNIVDSLEETSPPLSTISTENVSTREASPERDSITTETTVVEKTSEVSRRRFVEIFFKQGSNRKSQVRAYGSSGHAQTIKQLGSNSTEDGKVGSNIFEQPRSALTENWRKVLRVLIKGKEYLACPDSGSDKNIISESLALDQKLEIRRRPKDIKPFELGNGSSVWSTGRVQVNIQVPNLHLRRTKLWFYVFNTCPVSLVLGMSFLAKTEILRKNWHVLENCPPNLGNVSSLYWIGSPRSKVPSPKQPKNRLGCWLDGRYVVAVADTGSDLNIISQKCAEREGFPVNTRPEARSLLQFGDGTQGETLGQVYIYNLTLDWRSPETRIVRDTPLEPKVVEITPGSRPDQSQDEEDVIGTSVSDTTFHVLDILPCDVILGRSLLERTDAFNACPRLLAPRHRGINSRKPFQCNILICLSPLSKKLGGFRNIDGRIPTSNTKESHDNERHVEMYRRSEKEKEIESLPEAQRAREKTHEESRVAHWNAAHIDCAHCNAV